MISAWQVGKDSRVCSHFSFDVGHGVSKNEQEKRVGKGGERNNSVRERF